MAVIVLLVDCPLDKIRRKINNLDFFHSLTVISMKKEIEEEIYIAFFVNIYALFRWFFLAEKKSSGKLYITLFPFSSY